MTQGTSLTTSACGQCKSRLRTPASGCLYTFEVRSKAPSTARQNCRREHDFTENCSYVLSYPNSYCVEPGHSSIQMRKRITVREGPMITPSVSSSVTSRLTQRRLIRTHLGLVVPQLCTFGRGITQGEGGRCIVVRKESFTAIVAQCPQLEALLLQQFYS